MDFKRKILAVYVVTALISASIMIVIPEDADADVVSTITGDAENDNFGHSLDNAGDVNGDGIDDIIIGAPGHDDGRGRAYIYYGMAGGINDIITADSSNNDIGVRKGTSQGDWLKREGLDAGACPISVIIADANNDGYNDTISADFYADWVNIYSGTSRGGWDKQLTIAVGKSPASVFVGDANNDGYNDIVTANYNDDTVSILNGTAGGSWEPIHTLTAGWDPYAVFVADANNDGYNDIVISEDSDGTVSIFNGTAAGSWEPRYTLPVGSGARSVHVGDANNDGFNDIVTISYFDNTAVIYNGTGGFDWEPKCSLPVGVGPWAVYVGDANNDGYNDILTADSEDDTVTIYNGSGVGGWKPKGNLSVGDEPRSVFVGDANNDGYNDILSADYNDHNVTLYNGTSGGIWENAGKIRVGFYVRDVYVGDVDNAVFKGPFVADDADVILEGHNVGDRFGFDVSGAGDMNGDGYDDVVVGAPGANESYVYFGDRSMGATMHVRAETRHITKDTTNMISTGNLKVHDYQYYIVAKGKTMFIDSFDIFGLVGDIIDVKLTVGYLTLSNYNVLNAHLQWALDGQPLQDTEIIISPSPGTLTQKSCNLFNLGVDDYAKVQTLDISFTNTESGGNSDVRFDLLWLEVTTRSSSRFLGLSSTGDFGHSVSDAGDVNADGLSDVVIGAPDISGGGAGNAYLKHGNLQTFDDEIIGNDPSGWTNKSTINAYAKVSDDVCYGPSGKSVKFWNIDDTNYARMDKKYSPATRGYVEFHVYMTMDDSEKFYIELGFNGTSEGKQAVRIGFGNTSTPTARIRYYDGNGSGGFSRNVIQKYETGTWYHFEILFDCTKNSYDIFIDGVLKVVDASFIYNKSKLDTLYFGQRYGELTHTEYIDNVVWLGSNKDASVSVNTNNNEFGFSVSGAGDLNGDSYDDVVIGSPGTANGTAYVYAGGNDGIGSHLTFQDDFEKKSGSWNDNGITLWELNSSQKQKGLQSIQAADTKDGYLTSDDIDLSTASVAVFKFWFRKTATEASDFNLQFFNGTAYNSIVELDGLGQDDKWLSYSRGINLSEYGVKNFRIRFNATLGAGEFAWVDSLSLKSWIYPEFDSFSDNYELDLSKWDDNGPSLWALSSSYKYQGAKSIEATDGSEGYLTSDDIDLTSASKAVLEFWYRKNDTEANDFTLQYYDGTSYVDIVELDGEGPDFTWLHFYSEVNIDKYDKTNFRIRFNATMGTNEYVWVDQLSLKILYDYDVVLHGETAGEKFGYSVTGVGNLFGKINDDIIIGAPGYSSSRGRAYLFCGGDIIENPADVAISGESAGDQFGYSVSGVRNFLGDGGNNAIVGAPTALTGKGKIYIFSSKDYQSQEMQASLMNYYHVGENDNDHFGWALSETGDGDGDGCSEVIIGAPNYDVSDNEGRVYLILGNASSTNTSTMVIKYVLTYDMDNKVNTTFTVGATIIIRTNIIHSDNSSDIKCANVTITAPDKSILVDDQPMILESIDGNDPSIWKLFNYTFTNPIVEGTYIIFIEAGNKTGFKVNETTKYALALKKPKTIVIKSNKSSLTANGTSTANLTIRIYDESNNPLPGLKSQIILNFDQGEGTFGEITDYDNGNYNVTYTSPTKSDPDAVINVSVQTIFNTTLIILDPGPLDHIVVTPSPQDVAANQTQVFSAKGYDTYNNNVTLTGTIWSTDVGSFTSTGDIDATFKAQTVAASGYVNATVGAVTGNATVNVVPAVLDSISLSPDNFDLVANTTQFFTAVGYDKFDNVISLSGTVWSTDVGSFSSTSDSDATFKAQTNVASGYVNATVGAVTGSAFINVTPDVLFRIKVSPDPVNISVNTTQFFTALGYDQFDNTINLTGTIWSTAIGTFTSTNDTNATYKAPASLTTGYVNASVGAIIGSAQVNITSDTLDYIIVTPNPVDVTAGDTQVFTAKGYDQYNNEVSITPVWSTTVGAMVGSTLNAQITVASGYVNATVGAVVGSASVNITPDVLDNIVVTPNPVDVTAGGSQIFSTKGYDQYGNEVTISPIWTTTVGAMAGSTLNAQTTVSGGYVNVTVGAITDSASVNITPDVLDNIVVTPNPINVPANKTEIFAAVGYDQYGNTVDLTATVWTTTVGSFISTTTTSADFKACTLVGSGYVNATVGTVVGSASIYVIPSDLYRISINPLTFDIPINSALVFTAIAYDEFDNVVELVGTIWSTTVGTFTNMTNNSVTFNAQSTVDSGFVNVTIGVIEGSALVNIIPDNLVRLSITPDPVDVVINGIQSFTLTGYDEFDNVVELAGTFWSTTVGTFTQTTDVSATFKAQSIVASGYMNVTIGGIEGSAVVNIKPGNLARIELSPKTVELTAYTTKIFTAVGYDTFDNVVSLTSTVWTTTIGSFEATASNSATFRAQKSVGSGYVNATMGGITGSVFLTVSADVLVRIAVSPSAIDVTANSTKMFITAGYDQYDNPVDLTNTIWESDIGTITYSDDTSAALLAQKEAAVGYIRAKQGTVSNDAEVNIVPDSLFQITLSPDKIIIIAGKTFNFSAAGYDKYGNEVTIEPLWSTSVGTMDGTNLTAQTKVGNGFIYAQVGSIIGSAEVIVIPDKLDRIVVLPNNINLEAGKIYEFTAIGYDQYNNIVSIDPIWTSDVGRISGGILTAQTEVGSGYVKAADNGITGTAVINVIPGPLHQIIVTPGVVEIVAGKSRDFTAAGYDIYGNNVSINPIWYSTIGTMSGSTLFVQTGVGFGKVVASNTGISGTANVTIVPEELYRIFVAPNSLEISVGMSHEYTAIGYDKYNNIVPIDPVWSTDVGTMDKNIFTAQSTVGYGFVTAKVIINSTIEIIGSANVNVILVDLSEQPGIIGEIPDQIKEEDCNPWTLCLTPFEPADKFSGTDLRWYVTGENNLLYILSGEYSSDDTLKFIPVPNAYGNNMIRIWLTNNDVCIDYQTIWVNITPVNDEPMIYGAPDLIVHYDFPYKFDYSPYVFDIDDPVENLTISTLETTSNKYTYAAELTVTYNYPKSMLGEVVYVTLVVSDGKALGNDIVKLTISDDWVPNLLKKLPDVTLYEGMVKKNVFDLDDYFTDADGDSLYYSYGQSHITVTINDDHTVDIESLSEWSGTNTVTFRAEDPFGALAEDTIIVTVLPINDPPTISGVPNLIVHYDYDYKFDLTVYVEDKDNETSELRIFTSNVENIRFDYSNHMLMILNYPESMLGMTIPVTITVSDGLETATQIITVTVTDDYPPEIQTYIPDVEFEEDTELVNVIDLDDFFMDPDGDSLFYTYGNTNIFVTIDEDNFVTFYSTQNWYGTEKVTFRAKDPFGALAEDTIYVTVIPVNDAPTIDDVPDQSGMVGEMWILDLSPYIDDVDNNILDLVVTVGDEEVVVNGLKLVFYSEKAVTKKISIIVSDGELSSIYEIQVSFNEGEKVIQVSSLFNWIALILILIIIISAIVVYKRYRGNYTIEEVYLIYQNGILMAHKSNLIDDEERINEDLLSSMLTAVQDFIKESFAVNSQIKCPLLDRTIPESTRATEWDLNQLQMEGHNILIERGEYFYLTVIFTGRCSLRLKKQAKHVTMDIKAKYGDSLGNWNGNMDTIKDIEEHLQPLLTENKISK